MHVRERKQNLQAVERLPIFQRSNRYPGASGGRAAPPLGASRVSEIALHVIRLRSRLSHEGQGWKEKGSSEPATVSVGQARLKRRSCPRGCSAALFGSRLPSPSPSGHDPGPFRRGRASFRGRSVKQKFLISFQRRRNRRRCTAETGGTSARQFWRATVWCPCWRPSAGGYRISPAFTRRESPASQRQWPLPCRRHRDQAHLLPQGWFQRRLVSTGANPDRPPRGRCSPLAAERGVPEERCPRSCTNVDVNIARINHEPPRDPSVCGLCVLFSEREYRADSCPLCERGRVRWQRWDLSHR